jgi:hypothetical protein
MMRYDVTISKPTQQPKSWILDRPLTANWPIAFAKTISMWDSKFVADSAIQEFVKKQLPKEHVCPDLDQMTKNVMKEMWNNKFDDEWNNA